MTKKKVENLSATNTNQPGEDWKTKAEEYLAGWQRAQADLTNSRKRGEEERNAFIKYANTDILLQLLPVLDNFKRAAVHSPETEDQVIKNWADGVKAIEKQFEMIMQNNGISQIAVNTGDNFDPNIHDALVSEESDQPSDTIVQEIEPGYMLNGRVLRAPKVKVSKGKKAE